MGRLMPVSNRLKVSLFILICCFNCLVTSSLTIEERLQAIEATNVEIKQVLAAKNEEVEQLKTIVIALKSQKDVANKDIGTANYNHPTEYSEKVAINGMPSSCADLRQIGHTLNGLYSVMGTEMIETVYCDFTKLPSETGFENRLGYVDVKSLPVYFYVQRFNDLSTVYSPITFELERVNIGGAMNLTTGIFTVPRTGVYFFTFSGLIRCTSSTRCTLGVQLLLNSNTNYVGSGYVDRAEGSAMLDEFMISFESTLNLKAGDRVWVEISSLFASALLHDNYYHLTHFTGQLLQENISQS